MEKAGMYVRLFFKENTTGSVRCGRGERKDTDGIKAEGVYGNGNGNGGTNGNGGGNGKGKVK